MDRTSKPPPRRSLFPARSTIPPTSHSTLPPTRSSMAPGRTTILPGRSSNPPEAEPDLSSPSVPAEDDVERTLERMTSTFGELGRLVGSTLGLPQRDENDNVIATHAPGAPAGIEHITEQWTPPEPGTIRIRVIDVCKERVETRWVEDLDAFLSTPRPDWVNLRWVDVDGLHAYVVSRLQRAYGFHTLAAEDVLHVPQRPRVDRYADHLFIVARMFSWRREQLVTEQISVFARAGLLVSFQELDEDVWNPIRDRMIQHETSKLRLGDASYLAYALLDATVDHCFPILERYGEMLDHLEDAALTSDANNILQEVHAIKRELTILRKAVWPMREVIAELSREDQMLVSPDTRTYLRDVYQHCVQIIDIIETFRELAASLTDLSLSMASNRMNEVMKWLTILSTVFIPMTFLAGVYGMNFATFPELHWKYSYPLFWLICIAQTVVLLLYFRRKGWIGKR
ncbi:MAG TPA: magnesium/cobalt transporter CorA [Polyangiales bacterium]|nr:magnesium/cobalt transporter CorA [Polyangiales bacterium]